jgi:hypothetical protein
MAGAGRKTFTSGSVLSASDVQNYLQDQSVMVFATTTARTSAIASPTEGMVTYIQSNDQMQIFNGSYWIPQAYGQAAGTASATTGALSADATAGGITITFPANRFTLAPILQCFTYSGRYIVYPTAVTSASATIAVRNVSAGTGADEVIYWTAIQMSSTSAAG